MQENLGLKNVGGLNKILYPVAVALVVLILIMSFLSMYGVKAVPRSEEYVTKHMPKELKKIGDIIGRDSFRSSDLVITENDASEVTNMLKTMGIGISMPKMSIIGFIVFIILAILALLFLVLSILQRSENIDKPLILPYAFAGASIILPILLKLFGKGKVAAQLLKIPMIANEFHISTEFSKFGIKVEKIMRDLIAIIVKPTLKAPSYIMIILGIILLVVLFLIKKNSVKISA